MTWKILSRLFFLICFVLGSPVQGKIIKIYSLEEVKTHITDLQRKSHGSLSQVLLLITLDRIIWQPKHIQALQIQNIYHHRHILNQMTAPLKELQRYMVYNLFTKQDNLQLVEKSTPQIIQKLQYDHVKVAGITAYLMGPVGSIQNHAQWADQALRSFSIDFSASFPSFPSAEITLRPEHAYRGFHSLFYKGTIHGNGQGEKGSKGVATVAFIQMIRSRFSPSFPRIVICVDDIETHLELFEQALKSYDPDIVFVGLLYARREQENIGPVVPPDEFKQTWDSLIKQSQVFCPSSE